MSKNFGGSKSKFLSVLGAVGIALPLVGLSIQPAVALPVPIFDDYPAAAPNYPSLGYEATGTSEFGDLVQFGGTDRTLKDITVSFSSWACEAGGWQAACQTTPGSGYQHPIKVTFYQVNTGTNPPTPGTVLGSITDSVTVPFRPSADGVNCTGGNSGKWYDTATASCVSGLAFDWTFDFSALNITLPSQVIVGIAFDTEHYGYNPLGVDGPYDSLNVSARAVAPPTVGTNDDTTVYLNSATNSSYNDNGVGGINVFRADSGWDGYNPIFRINAERPELANTGLNNAELNVWAVFGGAILLLGIGLLVGLSRLRWRA
ncbi:MAG: hypothetical protein KF844_04955 [Cryobacterium sp.]|nr:hypothetical protein [Cryobacterium sp.]